jgi:SAM-dependent methyltransferase
MIEALPDPHGTRTVESPAGAADDQIEGHVEALDWVADTIAAAPGEMVLDVAVGGRDAAASARAVVALDLTPASRRPAREGDLDAPMSDATGVCHVILGENEASHLPYRDASFDLVSARFAVHHFKDPARPVAEMARICRPRGRVAIVDVTADREPSTATDQNRIERLRDASHAAQLSLDAMADLLEGAGLRVVLRESRYVPRPVGEWLEVAGTPGPSSHQIRGELRDDLNGGPVTGLRPFIRGNELWVLHLWTVVVGVR